MTDYRAKSYGRNEEVREILQLFNAGKDVAMAGPRRLGKTFVLDRLVEAASHHGWTAVKIDVAGCGSRREFLRAMCGRIGGQRSGSAQAVTLVQQRLGQILEPRTEASGEWYQPLISLDHETYLERLVGCLNEDSERCWALLIDELPIFLKTLHDQGQDGVKEARAFMNLTSRLREAHTRVRWMVTGSIGLEPLARAGNYMGVLAKYQAFTLAPLTEGQAVDFVKDLADAGRLPRRKALSDAEARALVNAVGWRAAYYLDALAMKLPGGTPDDDPARAETLVEQAVRQLLQPGDGAAFGVWEEHLHKHYADSERRLAFSLLQVLATGPAALPFDTLLASIGSPDTTRDHLRRLLSRLHVEGFVGIADLDSDNPTVTFLNPLLRRWWKRFPPSAVAA